MEKLSAGPVGMHDAPGVRIAGKVEANLNKSNLKLVSCKLDMMRGHGALTFCIILGNKRYR